MEKRDNDTRGKAGHDNDRNWANVRRRIENAVLIPPFKLTVRNVRLYLVAE